jgi:hypothetical protein
MFKLFVSYTFADSPQLSNGQHEEACTFQEAAWQGLGQFQEKATGLSSCTSKGSEGRRLRVQSSSWPMAAQDLVASQLACMPLALKPTPCIWFGRWKSEPPSCWKLQPARLSQPRVSSLRRPPLINLFVFVCIFQRFGFWELWMVVFL